MTDLRKRETPARNKALPGPWPAPGVSRSSSKANISQQVNAANPIGQGNTRVRRQPANYGKRSVTLGLPESRIH
jgi:hypothetical protein